MKIFLRFSIVAGLLLVSACATLNKEECLNANWELIGYEDGSKGYAATRIGEHRKACAEHGVTPDLDQYNKGRERGLKVYCTPQNGYQVGQRSAVYRDVCPANMRADFRRAFDYGSRIRVQRLEINRYERDIAQSRRLINEMQEELDQNESLIIRGARGPRERELLVRRNHELQHMIADEEDRISRAVYEIDGIKRVIDDLVAENPYK